MTATPVSKSKVKKKTRDKPGKLNDNGVLAVCLYLNISAVCASDLFEQLVVRCVAQMLRILGKKAFVTTVAKHI